MPRSVKYIPRRLDSVTLSLRILSSRTDRKPHGGQPQARGTHARSTQHSPRADRCVGGGAGAGASGAALPAYDVAGVLTGPGRRTLLAGRRVRSQSHVQKVRRAAAETS